MRKNFLQLTVITVLLAAAGIYLGTAVFRLRSEQSELRRETEALKQKITEAEQAAAELEKQNQVVDNAALLERQARLQLNYKRPDENVVFIYQKPYNGNAAETAASAPPSNWWQRVWRWWEEKIK